MLRSKAVTLGLVAAWLAAAACTGRPVKPPTATPPPTAPAPSVARSPSYHLVVGPAESLDFSYPPAWSPFPYRNDLHYGSSLLFLSTDPVSDPCHRVDHGIQCGNALTSLSPGGVLISWGVGSGGPPHPPPPAPAGQRPITIGGRVGTYLEQPAAEGRCGPAGADRSVSVELPTAVASDESYGIQACFREPGVAEHVGEFNAMLASIRFTTGPEAPQQAVHRH